MKKYAIICAICAIALGGALIYAHASDPYSGMDQKHKDMYAIIDHNESFFFSSENVVETFERNGLCYIVYDDADAAFDNEVMRVDRETFDTIEATQSSKTGRMIGWLYLNGNVYSYIHDVDF